jgi:hypothetical protein
MDAERLVCENISKQDIIIFSKQESIFRAHMMQGLLNTHYDTHTHPFQS